MAGILGKAPDQYVQNQIEVRQSTHGSGILNGRTSEQIVFLNGNTSWIKLASAVSVSDSVLSNAGLESSLVGIELAKQNVLFGGTAAFDKSTNTTFQREGNTSYEFSEFGFVPMAGITDVSIKSLNRGSLKKAKVQIIAHSKRQFEIISILYMRLGYTVMLEWGNTYFLNDDYELQRIENTIIEDLFFDNAYKQSYVPIINAIPVKREKYHANYDGILGAVNNFDWSFKDDGSYEINLEILSLGDIIESTVSNVTPTLDLVNYVKFVEAIFPEFQGYDIDNSVISNALSLWKYFDTAPSNQGRTLDKLHIVLTDGTQAEVGSFLPNDDGSNAQATTGSGVALGVPIQQ